MRVKSIISIFLLSISSCAYAVQALHVPEIANIASHYKGIVQLYVKLGQQVKKGQLLFEENQDILNAQKEYFKSNMEFTKEVLDGAEKLTKVHSISKDISQQSMRDYFMAKSSYNLIKERIRTSKYYAPFDGTVTKILRYSGSGLSDNDDEIQVTKGFVEVNTANQVAMVCNRWPGIVNLKVKLGQKITKGQIIFVIDTKAIKIQKKKNESLLKYNKILYHRRKKLNRTQTVSLYKMGLAENQYKKAIMNVQIDEIKIKQSANYAPFDGIVTKVYRYSGSGNGAGKPVVDILMTK